MAMLKGWFHMRNPSTFKLFNMSQGNSVLCHVDGRLFVNKWKMLQCNFTPHGHLIWCHIEEVTHGNRGFRIMHLLSSWLMPREFRAFYCRILAIWQEEGHKYITCAPPTSFTDLKKRQIEEGGCLWPPTLREEVLLVLVPTDSGYVWFYNLAPRVFKHAFGHF